MFREMRRKKQQLPEEACVAVLNRATSGVLALNGDDGYPYAVPLSYVYEHEKLFFHCAKVGYKLDLIRRTQKVSFCVIDQDEVVPEEYTTNYRSVIAFGTARILENDDEFRHAIETLAAKYTPGDEAGRKRTIEAAYQHMSLIEVKIERMTGKESSELAKRRRSES